MKMMIAPRHYEKPPITEAIIDLRVELPPEIGLTELNKAHGGEEQSSNNASLHSGSSRSHPNAPGRFACRPRYGISSQPAGYWWSR
jgi:hypothetical protein